MNNVASCGSVLRASNGFRPAASRGGPAPASRPPSVWRCSNCNCCCGMATPTTLRALGCGVRWFQPLEAARRVQTSESRGYLAENNGEFISPDWDLARRRCPARCPAGPGACRRGARAASIGRHVHFYFQLRALGQPELQGLAWQTRKGQPLGVDCGQRLLHGLA